MCLTTVGHLYICEYHELEEPIIYIAINASVKLCQFVYSL